MALVGSRLGLGFRLAMVFGRVRISIGVRVGANIGVMEMGIAKEMIGRK